MPVTPRTKTIALLGGGRWGRALAENLCLLHNCAHKIFWVSSHGYSYNKEWISTKGYENITLHENADSVFLLKPDGVVIATANNTHAFFIQKSLTAGLPCFSEKPYSYRGKEAKQLIAMTSNSGLTAGVNLEFMCASYLEEFKKDIRDLKIQTIRIDWSDPLLETRHKEIKHGDFTTPITQDYLPHCLSIISSVTGNLNFIFLNLMLDDNNLVTINLINGEIPLTINLNRRGDIRVRKIALNNNAVLDFTIEPGYSIINNVRKDYKWKGARPLATALSEFISQLDNPQPSWKLSLENCLPFVHMCEQATEELEKAQRKKLEKFSNQDINNNVLKQLLLDLYIPISGHKNHEWLTDPKKESEIIRKAATELGFLP